MKKQFKNTDSMFPPLSEADENGILGVSRDLNVRMLTDAYYHGIFPWPVDNASVLWFSPPMRGILPFDDLHIPSRLKRALPKRGFRLKISENFEQVIRQCAAAYRPDQEGTWITPKIIRAYLEFHAEGFAHSFETWHNGKLVGGMYGISLGKLFCGESMFHTETDASKFALLGAIATLKQCGVTMIDSQMVTPATQTFGAWEIPREQYMEMIRPLLDLPLSAETLRKNLTLPEVLF